eukprot:53311-Pelagomonas_calceolata.AAC.1
MGVNCCRRGGLLPGSTDTHVQTPATTTHTHAGNSGFCNHHHLRAQWERLNDTHTPAAVAAQHPPRPPQQSRAPRFHTAHLPPPLAWRQLLLPLLLLLLLLLQGQVYRGVVERLHGLSPPGTGGAAQTGQSRQPPAATQ